MAAKKPIYEVMVGNVGRVHRGTDLNEARTSYGEYCALSNIGYGRCAHEHATLTENGEPLLEYTGPSLNDVVARELIARSIGTVKFAEVAMTSLLLRMSGSLSKAEVVDAIAKAADANGFGPFIERMTRRFNNE